MSIGSGNGLAPNRRQAIIWTNADLVHWRLYAALGGDGLRRKCIELDALYVRCIELICVLNIIIFVYLKITYAVSDQNHRPGCTNILDKTYYMYISIYKLNQATNSQMSGMTYTTRHVKRSGIINSIYKSTWCMEQIISWIIILCTRNAFDNLYNMHIMETWKQCQRTYRKGTTPLGCYTSQTWCCIQCSKNKSKYKSEPSLSFFIYCFIMYHTIW